LRVFAQLTDGPHAVAPAVAQMRAVERSAGVEDAAFYAGLQSRAESIKAALTRFLRDAKAAGEKVAGYGAAAKGNTLLNYAGVGADLIAYIADLDPAKQGKFTPGGHIPIVDVARLYADRPQWILILPWNLQDEIAKQLADVHSWGAKLVVAVPGLREI
jgi:hypothetical protein